ncbi:MAG: hypothetical protein AB7K24_18440, partial [Gemmataceae bacterium]
MLTVDGAAVPGTAIIEVPQSPFDRPIESSTLPDRVTDVPTAAGQPLLQTYVDPPLGYTGPSSVLPAEGQETDDFVPVEDRWRLGFPEWDRYNTGHPWVDDYPYVEGHWWDPYNQNVIKGDYPIIGQNTFLDVTAISFLISDLRQIPTPTTPFESTADPFSEEFFGRPGQ